MYYLNPIQNPSGAYSAPQSIEIHGFLKLPDNLLPDFIKYNGFVLLNVDRETITTITPNADVWEVWKAEQPEPSESEPSAEEQLRADVDYIAAMTGVTL